MLKFLKIKVLFVVISLQLLLLGIGVTFAYSGSSNNGGVVKQVNIVRTIDKADWNNRPTSATDGDYLIVTDTGASYRWSISMNEWIRPEVYKESLVLRGSIPYTVTQAGDMTGFTATSSAGGAVTYTGDYVTLDSVDATAEMSYLSVANGGSNLEGHYIAGLFQAPASSGSNYLNTNAISVDNGTKFTAVLLRQPATNSPRLIESVGSSVQTNPSAYAGSVSGAFTWVEAMRATTGEWYVWVDHSASPVIIGDDSSIAGGNDALYIGDTSGSSAGTLYLRDVDYITW